MRERPFHTEETHFPSGIYLPSFLFAFVSSCCWCTSSNERGRLRKVNMEMHKLPIVNPMTIFICKLKASPYTLRMAFCSAEENFAIEYEDFSRLFNWTGESVELRFDLTDSKVTAVQMARPMRPPRTRTWVIAPWNTATAVIRLHG